MARELRRLGFVPVDGETMINDIPVVPDYGGPGQHRVVLVK